MRSSLAFSTLRILPRSGRIAWKCRSRPCLADPPAESPSTIYNSLIEASLEEQSASFPGSALTSNALLRRVSSRALRAASRAREAWSAFSRTRRDTAGFSSMNSCSFSANKDSTIPRTSLFPSFVFVWPSNCGSGILTEMIAVKPSRTSSPVKLESLSLIILFLRA
ncbi:hypothetical protein D3C77_425650 [compost metagenome]